MAEPGKEPRRVGRPERPLNPLNSPVSRFAQELRQLRAAAGYPTYRSLARRALYSASVLSSAASGVSFPTLQVTVAFARACGADPAEWQRRWEAVAMGECAAAGQGTDGVGSERARSVAAAW